MTTIIIGDQNSGSRHLSAVDFMKRELANLHATTNLNMNKWVIMGDGTRVHLRLINGRPQAFIYTGVDGYVFKVPLVFDTEEEIFINFGTKGDHFLEGVPNALFNIGVGGLETLADDPVNATYLTSGYTPSLPLYRYFNILPIHDKDGTAFGNTGTTGLKEQSSLAVHFRSLDSLITVGGAFLTASSKVGRYILGFQGVHQGPTSTGGGNVTSSRVLVFDLTLPADSPPVYSAVLTGNWPDDSTDGVPSTLGFWSFDRAGTKACATFWVNDYHRFRARRWPSVKVSNPEAGFVSSYVLEVEFLFDDEGNFFDLIVTQVAETPDLCIAADYDYTTPGNELITAQLYGFDYRVDKAHTWAAGISARPSPASGQFQIGDHIRVIAPAKLGNLSKTRMIGLYEIVGLVYPTAPTSTTANQKAWSSGETEIAVDKVFTVTEAPAPTPPAVPNIRYYVVTAVPDDPTVPVFGTTAPDHITGSATNGNVTLAAIVPTLGPDRSLTAIEWTANTGGWSVGSILKVTFPEETSGGFWKPPGVRYYYVSSIGSSPNQTGSSPPTFTEGTGVNGNLTLVAVEESFPTHYKGDKINGNILLRNRMPLLAEEWHPSLSGATNIPKNSLFKVSDPLPSGKNFKADGTLRGIRFYEVVSWTESQAPTFGASPPTHTSGTDVNGNVTLLATTDHKSAADVFLRLKYLDGTPLQSLELAHNIDYFTDSSSDGTWYERTVGGSSSFAVNLTGLDLRVRGATAYSNANGSNFASMYDRDWHNGTLLPQSSISSLPPSNIYAANLLYQRVKFDRVRSTIAAIPYLGTPNGEILDACIYAPYITDLGKPTEYTDPDKTIDFRINRITDEHNLQDWQNIPDVDTLTEEPVGMIKYYHRNLFQNAFPGVVPIWNRFVIAQGWFKKRQRD